MANRFFDQLGGIISIKLRGEKTEKVINMALTRGIYIWDIKKTEDGLNMKVRASGYEALRNICDENRISMEIVDKEGLPFFKGFFKRRLGFLCGALIFIAALYLMSSFIWFVSVSGNKQLKTEKILVTAAKYGVYQGAARWNFSRSQVEEAMIRELTELAYVKVDIHGVRANIEVVEKIFPKKEITGPCHMVAQKDGIVEEVLVLEGQPAVKTGDVVARGDILISGIVFPQKSEFITEVSEEELRPYAVRARGQVKAKVSYQGYGECRLKSEKVLLSGNKSSKIYAQLAGKKILLKNSREKPYSLFRKSTEDRLIKTPWGNWGLYIITYEEQVRKVDRFTEQQAESIAREKAWKSLQARLGDQKYANTESEVLSSPSDPILRVKISVETTENIAAAEPINTGENGH